MPAMTVVWSKYFVRERLGLQTDSELAKLFGLSRSAVSQWPKNKPIPLLRRYMLQKMYPRLFASDAVEQDTEPEG